VPEINMTRFEQNCKRLHQPLHSWTLERTAAVDVDDRRPEDRTLTGDDA